MFIALKGTIKTTVFLFVVFYCVDSFASTDYVKNGWGEVVLKSVSQKIVVYDSRLDNEKKLRPHRVSKKAKEPSSSAKNLRLAGKKVKRICPCANRKKI